MTEPRTSFAAQIRLAGLDSTITRDRRGDISLMKLLPTRPVTKAYAVETPNPRIGELSLTDARIRIVDQAVRKSGPWIIMSVVTT